MLLTVFMEQPMIQQSLSKSDVVLARRWDRKLYYQEMGYPKDEDGSAFAESGY